MIGIWVGKGPALGDQPHRAFGVVTLGDQHTGAHRHTAVTSVRAMDVHLAARADRLERGACTDHQLVDGDGKKRAVDRPQPEQLDGRVMWVRKGTAGKAHVDDKTDAQFTQTIVIPCQRRNANE